MVAIVVANPYFVGGMELPFHPLLAKLATRGVALRLKPGTVGPEGSGSITWSQNLVTRPETK